MIDKLIYGILFTLLFFVLVSAFIAIIYAISQIAVLFNGVIQL